jgi:hypothetical protein
MVYFAPPSEIHYTVRPVLPTRTSGLLGCLGTPADIKAFLQLQAARDGLWSHPPLLAGAPTTCVTRSTTAKVDHST